MSQDAEEADIDMTPMIDVTFLLIIFFMVVSDMSALDIAELTLPFGDQAHTPKNVDLDENPLLTINVLPKGEIEISGQRYKAKESDPGKMMLKDFLKIEAESSAREPAPADNPGLRPSKLRVYIRADRDTRFEHVQVVFDACSKNAIYKTSLAASKENTAKGG